MMRDQTPSQSLLAGLDPILSDRYLAGECTPAELREIEEWISHRPARRAVLTGLRRGIRIPFEYPALATAPSITQRVISAIYGRANERGQRRSHFMSGLARNTAIRNVIRRSFVAKYAIAAGAIMACLLAVGLGMFQTSREAAQPIARTYTTQPGQRVTVTLPDGSLAVLAPATTLNVLRTAKATTVTLDGAALFTVKHHSGNPFTVIAGPSTTRVLGTTFMVRHYETDTAAIVAVRDGKVRVGSAVLSAAQQVSVTHHGVSEASVASSAQFGLSSGLLTFVDATLPEAIPELNRWYNVDIRLGDSVIAAQKVSGKFSAGSLTDLITALSLMYDIRIVQDGHIITLYSND